MGKNYALFAQKINLFLFSFVFFLFFGLDRDTRDYLTGQGAY